MPARVLIVEDNTLLRDVMVLTLDNMGYATMVSDGSSAASATLQVRPDLILLDLGLPTVNGEEVCRQIRSDATTAHVPIVAVTGGSVPEGMPVDDLLAKPFTAPGLLRCVQKWVGPPRPARDRLGRASPLASRAC